VSGRLRSKPEEIWDSLQRVSWGRRLEVVLTFAVTAARVILSHLPGSALTLTILAIAAAVFMTARPTRRWMIEVARRQQTWRPIAKYMSVMGTPEAHIADVRRVAVGTSALLRLAPRGIADDFAKASEALAVCFRARSVRVQRDPADASLVTLTVVTRDAFSGPGVRWPWTEITHSNLWAGLPFGTDEEARPVWLDLAEHHLLIGGEPGGGKSNALSLVVAATALDPSAQLWCFDAKLVELAPWRDVAKVFVGPDTEEANVALDSLRAEMDNRYKWLLDEGLRKVSPESGAGLVVVVVDELALYLQGRGKTRDAFALGLRDLVARGRAAGIIVVAATQKPAHDVIPTALRDLFGYRLALRCSTRDASDTVLGSGWAAEGYTASEISPATRGVGLLLAEAGVPSPLRCHVLDDADIERMAAQARKLREIPTGW
jgi:FtsK/SpoIIIE family